MCHSPGRPGTPSCPFAGGPKLERPREPLKGGAAAARATECVPRAPKEATSLACCPICRKMVGPRLRFADSLARSPGPAKSRPWMWTSPMQRACFPRPSRRGYVPPFPPTRSSNRMIRTLLPASLATLLMTADGHAQELIELPGKDQPLAFELSDVYHIGSASAVADQELLNAIGGAGFDEAGKLYLLNSPWHVVAIGPDGRVLGQFGRAGEGPGEFGKSAPVGCLAGRANCRHGHEAPDLSCL